MLFHLSVNSLNWDIYSSQLRTLLVVCPKHDYTVKDAAVIEDFEPVALPVRCPLRLVPIDEGWR